MSAHNTSLLLPVTSQGDWDLVMEIYICCRKSLIVLSQRFQYPMTSMGEKEQMVKERIKAEGLEKLFGILDPFLGVIRAPNNKQKPSHCSLQSH